MANVISNVFKEELLKGNHDFDGGATYKIALYTSSKTVSASDPTAYNTTNQVSASGTNYTTAGNTLANPSVTGGSSASTAFVDFDDLSFTSATISAQAALIYNTSSANTNAAIAVLDFGGVKTSTNGTFTIQFPTNDATSAILRIS